jgi:hypothetical protein
MALSNLVTLIFEGCPTSSELRDRFRYAFNESRYSTLGFLSSSSSSSSSSFNCELKTEKMGELVADDPMTVAVGVGSPEDIADAAAANEA